MGGENCTFVPANEDVGTVQQNIKPSLMISDERAVSVSAMQVAPLRGLKIAYNLEGGVCQLQPVGTLLPDVFQNRTNYPLFSSVSSRQTKYLRLAWTSHSSEQKVFWR